jgi:hypothetical protein
VVWELQEPTVQAVSPRQLKGALEMKSVPLLEWMEVWESAASMPGQSGPGPLFSFPSAAAAQEPEQQETAGWVMFLPAQDQFRLTQVRFCLRVFAQVWEAN